MKKNGLIKNFVKEGQKLPLYGVGPYIVIAMAIVTLIGILLSGNILKSGIVDGAAAWLFRIAGVIMIVLGVLIWYIGALGSDMDDSIADNKLKTDGIYAWVRNPMYSGWWIVFFGISLLWHNCWLIIALLINWGIMTVSLKNTEEKWLIDLYGDGYKGYMKRVNRCVPWPPRR